MEILITSRQFHALSSEPRLTILQALIKEGSGGLSAGTLAEKLNIPASTLSFHLRELHNNNLADCRREGRHLIYAPDYGGIRQMLDFLITECCQGDPRLCGPYIVHP